MSDLFGTDYNGRKAIPIFEGVLMYFPKAIAAVAQVSEAGNKQHNPGQPLHWARGKSMDQFNTAVRHMMDHRMGGGRVSVGHLDLVTNNGWLKELRDQDNVMHLAKAAWRVLAALELAIEEEEAIPQAKPGWVEPSVTIIESPIHKDDIVQRKCACGKKTFNLLHGSLSPTVIAEGHTHSLNTCV